jgi:hypothetical protein
MSSSTEATGRSWPYQLPTLGGGKLEASTQAGLPSAISGRRLMHHLEHGRAHGFRTHEAAAYNESLRETNTAALLVARKVGQLGWS